ncbi:hypothetical protein AJ80_02101 [Polytolypa hystricis UAMH7299]|uniref:VOC domain-containing protein n=1 Tax=Polytolypa hystricis (strain UAMH7299) TaxID=1447883 RepID=A0A2B7YS85_POLH7|nr:hypothetical protein AJ80_02101 [Polytolypa hystricis UAMH7299]
MAPKLIFVNLPVADLPASITFYETMGFTKSAFFSDPTAACMILKDSDQPTIHAMLMTASKFREWTPAGRSITDAKNSAQVILSLSAESREEVEMTLEKARGAGGKVFEPLKKYEEGMYWRSYADLDGHVWESVWVDSKILKAAEQGQSCSGGEN